MERQKDTGSIMIIVLLSLMVWGLVGYFVYDQFLRDDSSTINDNNNQGDGSEAPSLVGGFGWNDTIETENYWTGGEEGIGEFIPGGTNEVSIQLFLNSNGSSVMIVHGIDQGFGHRGTFNIENDIITYTITDWGEYDFNNNWIPQEIDNPITTMSFNIVSNDVLSISNDALLTEVGLLNDLTGQLTLTRQH